MEKRETAQAMLRAWRGYYGLSQTEAAERLGCTRVWLGTIETRDVPISEELARRIERVTSESPFEMPGIPARWWMKENQEWWED